MAAHGSAAEALKACPIWSAAKGSNLINCAENISHSANISPARKMRQILSLNMTPATRACWLKSQTPHPFFGCWAIKISSPAPVWPSSARVFQSEPIGFHPTARFFPKRNRLISGLCQAVVIVEAAAKSGTFITARQALEQGREVLAVPGHPMDARAAGCNVLIRDGACLVRSIDDILQAIYPATQHPSPQPPLAGQLRAQTIQATLPLPHGTTRAYQTRRKDLVETLHQEF
jgi:hypothetical protein